MGMFMCYFKYVNIHIFEIGTDARDDDKDHTCSKGSKSEAYTGASSPSQNTLRKVLDLHSEPHNVKNPAKAISFT